MKKTSRRAVLSVVEGSRCAAENTMQQFMEISEIRGQQTDTDALAHHAPLNQIIEFVPIQISDIRAIRGEKIRDFANFTSPSEALCKYGNLH